MNGKVYLKPGREKPVRQRHPWIFGGAIREIEERVADGDVADMVTAGGEFLARGIVNRRSQITARLVTWDEDETVDETFWRRRIERAIEARRPWEPACRLVYGESDGLPGLIVDRYGDWLVLQALTLGIEKRKRELAGMLMELSGGRGVLERSDVDVREKEGLEPASGLLAGEEPPESIEIEERGGAGEALRFLVDPRRGHKTGFYLDQAENRRKVARYAPAREALNLFAYTGAFAAHLLAAGARRVVNVDSSGESLALARRNLELNGLAAGDEDFIEGDVFGLLRKFRAEGRTFDLIVADPPKFAHSTGQVERAARAYKDLNLVSMQILRPGGVLATFSCSGLVSPDLFQKIVFGAALDAGREARIVEKFSQSPDHPILLTFPEAEYLKGLACRVA